MLLALKKLLIRKYRRFGSWGVKAGGLYRAPALELPVMVFPFIVELVSFVLGVFSFFSVISEITTILTPSISEGGEWGRWDWSRFLF